MFDRSTAGLITSKLDTNAITAKEAKTFLASNYGVKIEGRTKAQIIRGMFALVTQAETRAQIEADMPKYEKAARAAGWTKRESAFIRCGVCIAYVNWKTLCEGEGIEV